MKRTIASVLMLAAFLPLRALALEPNVEVHTRYLSSAFSNKEVLKIEVAGRPGQDPGSLVYKVEVCQAASRAVCRPLVPGQETFTGRDLENADKRACGKGLTFLVAFPAALIANNIVKGAATATLSSLLGVSVSPYVVPALVIGGLGYSAYTSLTGIEQATDLEDLQRMPASNDSGDIKVVSVSQAEKAIRGILEKKAASQTPAN